MSNPFVVIGGDAAGLSAASKCRREDPDREVIVFEKGRWISYAQCGMPYYVAGDVEELESLVSLTPTEVEERGIDLRREHEVIDVNPTEEVVTGDGPNGQFEQSYGDLLIATGASAKKGPFTTALSLAGVFTMHDMDATAAMRAYLADPDHVEPAGVDGPYVDRQRVRTNAALPSPDTVAIVGGGYVGVEMAEALTAQQLEVHVFQRSSHLLPPFGSAVGERVAEQLAQQGVVVHTDTAVEEIRHADSETVNEVHYGDDSLAVDMVVIGVGVQPNTDVLPPSIEEGDSGAVSVDEFGRTNLDSIFAAGDCAEAEHAVTGDDAWVPLGLTANRAGRAIGATVAGDPTPVGTVAGTAVVKAFDLGCGRTGIISESRARRAGFDPVSVTIDAGSRSGYYPGVAETTVTLVGDRESSRVLGGATVGTDRAAKRIDPLAVAIQDGLTVGELQRRDLGYAPPFSPVWDPILVAAKVLDGQL